MPVKTRKSPKKSPKKSGKKAVAATRVGASEFVEATPPHATEKHDLLAKFVAEFVNAGGDQARVGAVARKRLIKYFNVAVAPQLSRGVVWQGSVRKFVLHCMTLLARRVAKDTTGSGEITRALLDRHTKGLRPTWETRCPIPPLGEDGQPMANREMGPGCQELQNLGC